MSRQISRREILRAMALGGGLVAGKIWIPGQMLISIPKPPTMVWSYMGARTGRWSSNAALLIFDELVKDITKEQHEMRTMAFNLSLNTLIEVPKIGR